MGGRAPRAKKTWPIKEKRKVRVVGIKEVWDSKLKVGGNLDVKGG